MGSNMAEAHPVAFGNVVKAKELGAKVLHIDPHYSRTSALANVHIPIRAGSDIVFLGALIRHILENNGYFHDYVVPYTNAATLIREDYRDTEDLDGLFSGFDPETGTYADQSSWEYQYDEQGHPLTDPILRHPRCVFQIMRRHFARYTPEMVEQVCGVSHEQFQLVVHTLIENSGRERTTALCYAVGWTQQSKGVQIIRAGRIYATAKRAAAGQASCRECSHACDMGGENRCVRKRAVTTDASGVYRLDRGEVGLVVKHICVHEELAQSVVWGSRQPSRER